MSQSIDSPAHPGSSLVTNTVAVEMMSFSDGPMFAFTGEKCERVRKVSLYVDVYIPADGEGNMVDAALDRLRDAFTNRAPGSVAALDRPAEAPVEQKLKKD